MKLWMWIYYRLYGATNIVEYWCPDVIPKKHRLASSKIQNNFFKNYSDNFEQKWYCMRQAVCHLRGCQHLLEVDVIVHLKYRWKKNSSVWGIHSSFSIVKQASQRSDIIFVSEEFVNCKYFHFLTFIGDWLARCCVQSKSRSRKYAAFL